MASTIARVAVPCFAATVALAGLLALPRPTEAGEPKVDFVKHVKPILESACVKCHGPVKPKGRYRLDSRDLAFKGGEVALAQKSAAVVPGKPEESLMVAFVEATAPDKAKHVIPMPPKKEGKTLTDEQKALLRKWISEGAAWPDGVTLQAPKK